MWSGAPGASGEGGEMRDGQTAAQISREIVQNGAKNREHDREFTNRREMDLGWVYRFFTISLPFFCHFGARRC